MASTRLGGVGVVVVALSLFISACGSSDKEAAAPVEQPIIGGTLVDTQLLALGDPSSVDPALAADVNSQQVTDLVFDGLMSTGVDGQSRKAVAKDFKSNSQGTVWTFTLRDDVKFSDGTPVLPSDFKRGWERVLLPALESENTGRFERFVAGGATKLDSVKVDDAAHTLEITLNQADYDLPAQLALPAFSPVPPSAPSTNQWDQGVMVGNGPFVQDGPWERGKQIKLKRNPNYYGGPDNRAPYVDNIVFTISADPDAAYNDFAAGNGQIGAFPNAATADLQRFQKENIVDSLTIGNEFWAFNMDDPTVGGPENLKLRQAANLAIDKAEFNQKAYAGTRQIANQFSSPNTPGSEAKPVDGKPDVEGAKKLLKEWGKTPPEIKVSFIDTAEFRVKGDIMVNSLKAAGIPAVANPLSFEDYRGGAVAGKLQFFRFSWIDDYPSYGAMIYPPFSNKNFEGGNYWHYSNDAVEKLFTQASAEPSVDKRNEDYRQAEKLIMADQPIIPLNWTSANLIKDPKVRNLKVDPLGFLDYTSVWLAP